jgi:hypothetical protein
MDISRRTDALVVQCGLSGEIQKLVEASFLARDTQIAEKNVMRC